MLVVLPSALVVVLAYVVYRLPATLAPHHGPRPAWSFARSAYTAHVSTTGLNGLARRLVHRCSARQLAALKAFYNVGVLAGVLGALASAAFVVVEWARAWALVWSEAEQHARAPGVVEAVKRTVGALPVAPPDTGFSLLIPGFTAPLSHLPTLLLATIIAQLVHESAHALAAALDDLAPSRVTFGFFLCFPHATVAFSSAVDDLPAAARKRVAASGPWHNAVCWAALIAVGRLGLGNLVSTEVDGVVVHAVRYVKGSVITHLDDQPIAGLEYWGRYLASSDMDAGVWCVAEAVYLVPPCVAPSIAFQQAAHAFTDDARCLLAHPLLATPTTPAAASCPDGVLVRPAPAEQVLRIKLDGGDVVLFAGNRRLVLDDLDVSRTRPVIAPGFFRWLALCHEYVWPCPRSSSQIPRRRLALALSLQSPPAPGDRRHPADHGVSARAAAAAPGDGVAPPVGHVRPRQPAAWAARLARRHWLGRQGARARRRGGAEAVGRRGRGQRRRGRKRARRAASRGRVAAPGPARHRGRRFGHGRGVGRRLGHGRAAEVELNAACVWPRFARSVDGPLHSRGHGQARLVKQLRATAPGHGLMAITVIQDLGVGG